MGNAATKTIQPQPGFQWNVLSSPADVLIMGGAAGCGKTFALLLDPIRHFNKKGFAAMIFRREMVQVMNPGSLFEKAIDLYTSLPSPLIPDVTIQPPAFKFPAGSSLQFGHIQRNLDVRKYQGAELAYIGFDELTHFEQEQFIYLLSRNRTTCGIRPYIRASTNPQGSGWVKDMIQWWIYPDDYHIDALRGAPIPERSGVLRYFFMRENKFVWADSPLQLRELMTDEERESLSEGNIKSMSFIGGKLDDNQELLNVDPSYKGALMAQDATQQAQLLRGLWIDIDLDENRLYQDDTISCLFTNDFVERGRGRYLIADVAAEGSDEYVIGIWEGWVCVKIIISEKTPPNQVPGLITKYAKLYRVPMVNVCFDATGIGHILKGPFAQAFPFMGASAPIPVRADVSQRPNAPKITQFANLRSQCFWHLKYKMEDFDVFIDINDANLQRKTVKELRAVKKAPMDYRQKLAVISKDDMKKILNGKSPGIADMLSMRSVFDLVKPPAKPSVQRVQTY